MDAAAALFLWSALSLYELLICARSPSATAFFNALKNMLFNHLLMAGRLPCMCFLMEMEEEQVRSFSSVMAVMIPALCDMVMIVSNCNDKKGSVPTEEQDRKW